MCKFACTTVLRDRQSDSTGDNIADSMESRERWRVLGFRECVAGAGWCGV